MKDDTCGLCGNCRIPPGSLVACLRMLDEFARRVRAHAPSAAIWAFGSRVRGSADPDSDLDLCVVLSEVTRELRETIHRPHSPLRRRFRASADVREHARREYSPRRRRCSRRAGGAWRRCDRGGAGDARTVAQVCGSRRHVIDRLCIFCAPLLSHSWRFVRSGAP
jgi:predicted nucleotidyltransferase